MKQLCSQTGNDLQTGAGIGIVWDCGAPYLGGWRAVQRRYFPRLAIRDSFKMAGCSVKRRAVAGEAIRRGESRFLPRRHRLPCPPQVKIDG